MMYPLVVDLTAEGVRVTTSCRLLGFSTPAFYRWRARPYSDSEWDDAHLLNEIVDLHRDDPEFGYRFIADELRAAGDGVGENRVHRLCRENQVWSVIAKKRGHGRKTGPPVHDDLVQRHFNAPQPDEVWMTDIERHEAFLNLAVVKGHRHVLVVAGALKLRAALIRERRGGWTAALTTTERASTVRWSGSGKQDGKAYVRNQRLNAPQEQTTSSNLTDLGWAATRTHTTLVVRGTLRLGDVAGREATVNVCGVGVARLQGHSWSPTPSKGSRVNVGTTSPVPPLRAASTAGGKTRCRLMPVGWGGGSVVVRARESRVHGEGVQRVRSGTAECGGRW